MNYMTLAAACLSAIVGYSYSASSYQSDIDAMKSSYERSARLAQEKSNAEILEREARFSSAISERDVALADARKRERALSESVNRMRQLASPSGRTVPATAPRASDTDSRADAECRRLLVESADLLREGADLLAENAVTHDALVKSATP